MVAENNRADISPAMIEIIKNSLVAITDEMGVSLKKSSYSPNIKKRSSCSIIIN